MSLTNEQALIAITVTPGRFAESPEKIRDALVPYPNARIISITRSTDWFGWSTKATLLVVIEYSPGSIDNR